MPVQRWLDAWKGEALTMTVGRGIVQESLDHHPILHGELRIHVCLGIHHRWVGTWACSLTSSALAEERIRKTPYIIETAELSAQVWGSVV